MDSFHSCRPGHVEWEIWTKRIAYNITEAMVQSLILEKHDTKHVFQVNFLWQPTFAGGSSACLRRRTT